MLVNEIFQSVQGEGYWAGHPSVFIRFSGCNLGCPFCDTNHQKGEVKTVRDIVQEVMSLPSVRNCRIILTGGEPFIHKDLLKVVKAFQRLKFKISIETNGLMAEPIPGVWITCSPKTILPRYDFFHELKFLYGRIATDRVWDSFKHSTFRKEFKGIIWLQPLHPISEPKLPSNIIQKVLAESLREGVPVSFQTHKLAGVR